MTDRNGQPAGQPTPATRAAARYKIASTAITQATQTAGPRTLTTAEAADFTYLHTVMRDARTTLADAGRLDLIGATV